MGKQEQDEAATNLRRALDDVFRRNWRLRKMLDFSRPHRLPQRAFTKFLPRVRRERVAEMLRHWLTDDLLIPFARLCGLTLDEYRKLNLDFADLIAPHCGHRFIFNADFVAKVDDWIDRLSGGGPRNRSYQVRTHRISRPRLIKKAIQMYFLNDLGRQPTSKETKNAQAVYSQRTRRSRSTPY